MNKELTTMTPTPTKSYFFLESFVPFGNFNQQIFTLLKNKSSIDQQNARALKKWSTAVRGPA